MSAINELYEYFGLARLTQSLINILILCILGYVAVRLIFRSAFNIVYSSRTSIKSNLLSAASLYDWQNAHGIILFKALAAIIGVFLIIVSGFLLVRAIFFSLLFGLNSSDLWIGILVSGAWLLFSIWYLTRGREIALALSSTSNRHTGGVGGPIDAGNSADFLSFNRDNHVNDVIVRFEGNIQSAIEVYSAQSRNAVNAGRLFAFAASIAPFFTWLYFTRLVVMSDDMTLQKMTTEKLSNLGVLTFLGASNGFVFLAIAVVLFKYARTLADKITLNEKRLYYLRKLRVALIAFPSQADLEKGILDSLLKTGDGFEAERLEDKVDGALDHSVVAQTVAHLIKGSGKS